MAKSSKDLDIVGNVTPTSTPSLIKPEKEHVQKVRKDVIEKDARMVKGTFVYEEYPGSHFPFKIGPKWKELPIFEKDMWDGQTYTIPKWAADWINGRDESKDAMNPNSNKVTHSCQIPKNKMQIKKDEFPQLNLETDMVVDNVVAGFKPKMRFIPLTFGD
jgi:hypothetical protein